MNCTPARELPEGRHLVRVFPQSLRGEAGEVVGCWVIPSGWYYTDAGRARISAAVDVWQGRIEVLQSRLDAMGPRIEALQSSAEVPPLVPCGSPEHDPSSFATAALCLAVGYVLGFFSRRRA